jgi:site-specific recombinase XerD
MNLQQLIEQYIAFRKSLGELQGTNADSLRKFGRSIGADADIADVCEEQVAAFVAGTASATRSWHHRFSVVRTFYRYAVTRHYVAAAPLPRVIPKRPPPFVPYIYTRDDLRRLLQAVASDRRQRTCLEPITTRTILLLMYGAGLRVREVVSLDSAAVDLAASLLTIQQTKFGKTRLVPVGPQLKSILEQYASRLSAPLSDAPFFTTRRGTRVKIDTLQQNFEFFRKQAGIVRNGGTGEQPRLHDLRHTFAVHRVTSWYQQGANVNALLPMLSTYLGHVHLRHTQIYLSMTPALLHEANKRFGSYLGKEEVDV